jgi:hypothetical protein
MLHSYFMVMISLTYKIISNKLPTRISIARNVRVNTLGDEEAYGI